MIMKHKIALIAPQSKSHRTAEETIALGYLASVLRQAKYEVVIIEGWLRKLTPSQIVDEINKGKYPSVIGISCYRSNLEQVKEILDIARERDNILSLCGGYGPTFHDEDFLDIGFSVAVRGEAEHIIVQVVEALLNDCDLGSIPGISYKAKGSIIRTDKSQPVKNLDNLLFPARDEILYSIQQKNPVHVCSSRGCMGHCTFCSIAAFSKNTKGMMWRGRSIQNIIDELRYLYETFGISDIKFVDDSFLEYPRDEHWAEDFSDKISYCRLPLRFRTQVRADRLTLPIVKSLKRAGWFATSIGVENGSQKALKRMNKSACLEDNLKALEWLHDNGIYVQMGMILFDHATTMDELKENYLFLRAHDWVITKGLFTEMYAAKGTIFTRKMLKAGLLNIDNSQQQNYCYAIIDKGARCANHMLKKWHQSHSYLYDWVIDSISAPKILPNDGYKAVSMLCQQLLNNDLDFFQEVISYIQKNESHNRDNDFIDKAILESLPVYKKIERSIKIIYNQYDLTYDAIPNPFINYI